MYLVVKNYIRFLGTATESRIGTGQLYTWDLHVDLLQERISVGVHFD